MFSKLSLSLIAALALSASAGSGNPDSTDYGTRMQSRRSPSNEEINAAETGNPDSVDNRNQAAAAPSGNWQEAWQAAEFGNPDFR
jgi:hypothetical protein